MSENLSFCLTSFENAFNESLSMLSQFPRVTFCLYFISDAEFPRVC